MTGLDRLGTCPASCRSPCCWRSRRPSRHNVHFAESLRLEEALFAAGKSDLVDFLPVVGQTHLFHEPRLMVRYWQRVLGFFEAHLQRAAAAGER